MSTYLDETYLGPPADLGPVETGSASNLPSLAGDPNQPVPAGTEELVRLPGGVILPKKTLILIVGAILVVAFIWYLKTRKKD
jgi:hypothetical protein